MNVMECDHTARSHQGPILDEVCPGALVLVVAVDKQEIQIAVHP
jgi:hypothetical protein